ncbi:MAG: hypothetical protein IKL03_03590 [Bacteroidaceae bacterium]|nr:hypothetical protein [Bacteroidaceae bacterium]
MSRRTQYDKSISVLCAVLFAIFSFIYIYVFQGELLALMQDHLSGGVTQSNTFLTAFLLTLLLGGLQWLINRNSKLHGRWEALSYIPSCILLALVTDVNDGTMLYSASKWLWSIPISILLYIGVVWLNRMMTGVRKRDFFGLLWPNLLAFTLLFVFTAQVSNHAPAPHMELAAWHYIHDSKYDKVLEVGSKSDDYNPELTALRNLALAKTGQLGERLFHYPQPYGADGLVYNRHNKQSNAYGAAEFYRHLSGNIPYGGENGRAYTYRMAMKNDSAVYRDLYLAALLLDKDLEAFVKETGELTKADTLCPTHYQEAWILYNEQHPDSPVAFIADSAMVSRFAAYRELQSEYDDNAVVAENLCRRKFGKTFWCYYDY